MVYGTDAVELARTLGLKLQKAADPIDGAREVSAAEAEEILRADPQLISLDPLAVVKAELKRIGVHEEGEGGVVVQEVDAGER